MKSQEAPTLLSAARLKKQSDPSHLGKPALISPDSWLMAVKKLATIGENAMSYRLFFTALVSVSTVFAPAQANDPADAHPDASKALSLTIYGDKRALVEDVRDIRFAGGEEVVELPGVSSAILPQSVTIKAANMEIIEQNFDFDLLTPEKLMEKAVGEFVEIVKTNPATGREMRETAKVLSVNNGVVIQVGDRIEVLRDDKIPTRVIFPKVPENLRASPTLSLRVDASAGTREANMTYISSGLTWKTDYVVMFAEAAKKMSLQGWATIDNTTNTTFHDAEIAVVAGHVNKASGHNRYNNNRQNYNQRRGGIEAGSADRIGDNYIYTLPGQTTLASKQKKQISFVDAEAIKAEKVYEYRNNGYATNKNPVNVDSRIAFSNSSAAGMGEALPAGTVRVYTEDKNGKAQFIGENTIGHIAAGSDISMKIGNAFDITVKPTLIKNNKVSNFVSEYEMLLEVRNASRKDVKVNIYQNLAQYWSDYEVLEESVDSTRKDASTLLWTVDVPSQGQTDLIYKIRETRPW